MNKTNFEGYQDVIVKDRKGNKVRKLVVHIEMLRKNCQLYATKHKKTISCIMAANYIPTNIFANAKYQYVGKVFGLKAEKDREAYKAKAKETDYGYLTPDELIDICKTFQLPLDPKDFLLKAEVIPQPEQPTIGSDAANDSFEVKMIKAVGELSSEYGEGFLTKCTAVDFYKVVSAAVLMAIR